MLALDAARTCEPDRSWHCLCAVLYFWASWPVLPAADCSASTCSTSKSHAQTPRWEAAGWLCVHSHGVACALAGTCKQDADKARLDARCSCLYHTLGLRLVLRHRSCQALAARFLIEYESIDMLELLVQLLWTKE